MFNRIKKTINSTKESFKDSQAKGAQRKFMEELFNDLYLDRARVYRMNFVRGIFFGLGSVLGGTVVLALAIWILSFFVDFPLIGQYFEQTQDALQDARQQ